ncbi:MAG: hypothetical protein AAF203_09445 [Pseudomonadota bacterium]
MKPLLFVVSLFFFSAISSHAVTLLQEEHAILCTQGSDFVEIDKKDRRFRTRTQTYQRTEFLDKAILGESSSQKALIHMTPQKTASLIEGKVYDFIESFCAQVEASKFCCDQGKAPKNCSPSSNKLIWSPTQLSWNGVIFDVAHYGVYSNDGTFFLGYNKSGLGLAIVDFGSKFKVIYGSHKKLNCDYK